MTGPEAGVVASVGTAVVLVAEDDAEAPHGCAALRPLRGAAVLRWSVSALTGPGVAAEVLVLAPPMLAVPAARAVHGLGAEVVPVPGVGSGHRLLAVLRLRPDASGLVAVHDPLHPLAPGALVATLARAFGPAAERAAGRADGRLGGGVVGPAAAVPVHPLTETVKRMAGGLVRETVDRSGFVVTATPQVYRRDLLRQALEAAGDADLLLPDPACLPDLLLRQGLAVLPVPVPDPGPRVGAAEALDRVAAALG